MSKHACQHLPQGCSGTSMPEVSRESIRPGMDVYDHDGVHLGWVKDVHHAEFLVGRRWHRDVRVPLDQVLAVLDQRVVLTVPRARAGTAEGA